MSQRKRLVMHLVHHVMHLRDLDRRYQAGNLRRAETGRMAEDVEPGSFEDGLCRNRRLILMSPIQRLIRRG